MLFTAPSLQSDTPTMHSTYEHRSIVFEGTAGISREFVSSMTFDTGAEVVVETHQKNGITGELIVDGRERNGRVAGLSSPKTDEELRIFLLARKYGSRGFTPEDSARLAIVSQRLELVLTVINEQDVELLEKAAATMDESTSHRRSIARKYGLE